jgi:hypothetical protein
VIIKTANNNIFGGYVEVSWSGGGSYKSDSNAFLFSLVNPSNNPLKMPISVTQYAIYAHPSYGPTFGGGHDLYTPDQPNSNNIGLGGLGHSYKLPNFLTYGSSQAGAFFDGASNARATEIEVFVRKVNRSLLV